MVEDKWSRAVSTEGFSESLELAIRSYSIRLQLVARNLQNLRQASLRPPIRHNPQATAKQESLQ